MKKIIYLGLVLSVLTACETKESEDNKTDQVELFVEQAQKKPHDIILLNGEKWKVDEGMMVTIQLIANEVKSFQGKTIEDYQTYSVTLSNLIAELTSNCTMKGQAHDELHKWLVPFIHLSKDLKKSTDIAELTKIDGELKSEIIIFGDYFE